MSTFICFYQKSINGRLRTLKEVSGSLKDVFLENPWLHAGPHGLDNSTPPHLQQPDDQIEVFESIYEELQRFAGCNAMSKWIRLHQFSESYELAEYFKSKGVEALLSTDKDAVSYRLPENERESGSKKMASCITTVSGIFDPN